MGFYLELIEFKDASPSTHYAEPSFDPGCHWTDLADRERSRKLRREMSIHCIVDGQYQGQLR